MNFSTLYLFFCIIFVGKGDDQRNKRSREIVDSDTGILKESEGIEREAWVYDHNFDVAKQDNQNDARYKNMNLQKINLDSLKEIKSKKIHKVRILKLSNGDYSSENTNVSDVLSLGLSRLYNSNKNQSKQIIDKIPKWPKFEDLLLSVGVEYDWKSDRWIKIKEKATKISNDDLIFFNKHKEISHKHYFKYRTVRLNGSKNRKNVIIAVTAVR